MIKKKNLILNKLFFIIIALFLINCNNNDKIKINKANCNINLEIIKSNSNSINKLLKNDLINFRIDNHDYVYDIWMHSYNKEDHYFRNTNLEIQFSKIGRRKLEKNFQKSDLLYFFIGTCPNNYYKCFYLIWLFHFPLNNREYRPYLGNFSDTIYSNLNYKSLNELFPKFKGICINNKVNQIIVDYRYFNNKEDLKFFDSIKFIGFDEDYNYLP